MHRVPIATLIVVFSLVLMPTAVAVAVPSPAAQELTRISLNKSYRLWVDRQCKIFRRQRSELGAIPDVTSEQKFIENGQDYADREESVAGMLSRLATRIGARRAPNRDTAKGINKLLDAISGLSAADLELVGLIRQGGLSFDEFAHKTLESGRLRVKIRELAKKLGLRECSKI